MANLAQVKAFDGANYATAAQGTLADSSTQPGDNVSTLTNDAGYSTTTGTVTNVGGTGAVNGLSLSGTVTSSGNLTLGGTLAISNADWSGTDLSVANGGTGASTLAANNVLLGNGASALQTVAPGASGNVLTSNGTTWQSTAPAGGGSTLEATASGALANGDLVSITTDGKVEVTTGSPVAQAVGTPTVYQFSYTLLNAVSYDVNAGKVVIVYRNVGGSNAGVAVVGTVSGTSISFGTPVNFASSVSWPHISYDATAQKHLIVYQDTGNSNYGTARVGTVSGTSISFGTAVVFESASSDQISAVYDTSAGKHVVVYRDNGNSGYGTGIVGTISGTSVSFGSATVFESAQTRATALAYDSNESKVVVSYRDNGNSDYGTAAVGTVSGTSISFGTPVVFESAGSFTPSSTYDPDQQRVVISYRDAGNSNYGTVIAGDVSGTSITFGTPVVYNSGYSFRSGISYNAAAQKTVISYPSGGTEGKVVPLTLTGSTISVGTSAQFTTNEVDSVASVYDSEAKAIVTAYQDKNNSDRGTGFIFRSPYIDTNIEKYIGISDGAYSDAATATVQIIGAVDDAQSGLTAGQAYYVQTDGTLATTPDTPSVFAGTAISSTKLIVKG